MKVFISTLSLFILVLFILPSSIKPIAVQTVLNKKTETFKIYNFSTSICKNSTIQILKNKRHKNILEKKEFEFSNYADDDFKPTFKFDNNFNIFISKIITQNKNFIVYSSPLVVKVIYVFIQHFLI